MGSIWLALRKIFKRGIVLHCILHKLIEAHMACRRRQSRQRIAGPIPTPAAQPPYRLADKREGFSILHCGELAAIEGEQSDYTDRAVNAYNFGGLPNLPLASGPKATSEAVDPVLGTVRSTRL